ncbi:MAG: hypothetical protein ACU83U_15045, partial [Gammaproteobacteria bacterium]
TASSQTLKLLNNHRCVIKPGACGLTVYVPVDNQQPLIPFADNSQLRFDLKLHNNDFPLYTDQRIEPSTLSGLHVSQAEHPVSPEQIISTTPNANGLLLSITVQRDFNRINAVAGTDEIRFFAKPALWFYYVVTDPGNSEQLTIVDAGQETNKTTWQSQKAVAGDDIYTQLTQQYPNMTIVRFNCEQSLACRESGTKHLQLKQGDHIIFEQLPNPCYRNYFHTETTTTSKSTDAIYEIVQYISNTTLIKG